MSDFNKFDSRRKSTDGSWLHLLHPTEGTLMYDRPDGSDDVSKPCRVLLMGTESPVAQELMAETRRAKAKAAAALSAAVAPLVPKVAGAAPVAEEDKAMTFAELHDAMCINVASMVMGFENIDRGDTPAKAPVDVSWFLNLQMVTASDGELTFVQQCATHTVRRSNYMGNA